MGGTYKVIRLGPGVYTWKLMSRNHRVLLRGSTYASRDLALAAIDRVRLNATRDGRYSPDRADSGEPCFMLLDEKDRILGRSVLYLSDGARNRGMAAVRSNAHTKVAIESGPD